MSARERMQAAIRNYLGLGGSAHTVVSDLITALADRDAALAEREKLSKEIADLKKPSL